MTIIIPNMLLILFMLLGGKFSYNTISYNANLYNVLTTLYGRLL